MPPKVRCTNVQKRVMCEYMAAHTLFANGEYSGPLGATRHEAQWRELAGLLKEYGPDKPVQAWKTTWRDVKRKARGENAAARKAGVATGNMCDIPFVGEEVGMVLSVIGEECSVGIGPQESGIGGLIHTQLVKSNELRREHIEVLREQNRILATNREMENTVVVDDMYTLQE